MTEGKRYAFMPWSAENKDLGKGIYGMTEGKARVSFDLGYSGVGSLIGKLPGKYDKPGSIISSVVNPTEEGNGSSTTRNTGKKGAVGGKANAPDIFSFSEFQSEQELGEVGKDEEVKLERGGGSKRNIGKVSYTYRPSIRPSSPGYMASTAASRSRASSNGSVGKVINWKLEAVPDESSYSSVVSSDKSAVSASIVRSKSGRSSGRTLHRGSSKKARKGSRLRRSLANEFNHGQAAAAVTMKEKLLMKMFNYLEWTELLAIRSTCKKWYEIISTEAPLQKVGVICLRRNLEGMGIFNKSMYVWTQFRILVSGIFDFTDPVQNEFWNKHGKTMSYLQIRNSSMTLSALVEILTRCPNLEHFTVTWTAEMYSFNSEMIKKYYGIQFRNGTFVKLHELVIDKSYFLTDNALWSLLKWCGGSIFKLALSCGPEDQEDSLSRLKPRWSIEPIQNYASRFGYSGNFRLLDFSGSNLSPEDLKVLAKNEKLHSLIGIRLTQCKIDDDSLGMFIVRKGSQLEELFVDQTSITEKAFEESTKLPRLRVLNISGRKGNFHHLDFFPYLKSLEEFICADTTWLTYSTLARPLEAFGNRTKQLRKFNLSSSVNIISRVDQRMSKIWFGSFARFCSHLTGLNLSHCGGFGNDDNFKAICMHINALEALSVRDWNTLTDEGVIGMSLDDISNQYEDNTTVKGYWKPERPAKISPALGNLKRLKYLDLGGCKRLSDSSVLFAIMYLENLSKLSLEKTQITDASVHLLVSKTTNLNRLCVSGCENVAPINMNFVTKPNGRLIFFGKI